MFIRLTPAREGVYKQGNKIRVSQAKIFSNEHETQNIIDQMKITEAGQGVVWGKSALCEGPIHFDWRGPNQMNITTIPQWSTFFAFLINSGS